MDYNKDAGAKAVAALSKEFGAGRCVCLLPLKNPNWFERLSCNSPHCAGLTLKPAMSRAAVSWRVSAMCQLHHGQLFFLFFLANTHSLWLCRGLLTTPHCRRLLTPPFPHPASHLHCQMYLSAARRCSTERWTLCATTRALHQCCLKTLTRCVQYSSLVVTRKKPAAAD